MLADALWWGVVGIWTLVALNILRIIRNHYMAKSIVKWLNERLEKP